MQVEERPPGLHPRSWEVFSAAGRMCSAGRKGKVAEVCCRSFAIASWLVRLNPHDCHRTRWRATT